MNPLALGGIVQAVGQLADNLVTTDKERLDAELELRRVDLEERKVDADLVRGQLEVNRTEAASSSLFVAGWQPSVFELSLLAGVVTMQLVTAHRWRDGVPEKFHIGGQL